MYKSPVYNIISVPIEKIRANAWNPNAVAPPEMKLLYQSIKEDGYTMPIVCYYLKEEDVYVCPKMGIILPYKNIDKNGYKKYYHYIPDLELFL